MKYLPSIRNDLFSAVSHLIGMVLSIYGLRLLLDASRGDYLAQLAAIIYGVSLILLFLASTLLHAIDCPPKMSDRLEQLDYAAIFLLIAGTYTPVGLLIIGGLFGCSIVGVEWLLAFIGIYLVFSDKQISKGYMVAIYLVMGWLFVIAFEPLVSSLTPQLIGWLVAGGLFYSLGAMLFLINWRPLWRGCFSGHDVWHLFVLGGSTCHFVMIENFIRSHYYL